MKNPIIPMCAIVGKPTKAEIYDYMKKLNTNAIESIVVYARSGCELEYLSNEWFDTVQNYILTAKELDMSIWIYDDFNWPSGHAGGIVTKNPDFRLKSIICKGDDIGKIKTYPTMKGSLFNEKYFPDLLSHQAVDCFIECTYQEYYKRFKEYFGNVISGFFTDEPSISYSCDDISIPYYDGIENDYKTRFERDFINDLKSEYKYFKRNVMTLSGDKFEECFTNKIAKWCTDHQVILTGHLMKDELPYSSMFASGKFLKNLKNITLPGIDNIITDLKSVTLLPLLSATEYASGNHGAMAELFALGPCDMPFALKRAMIFMAACFKINHYFVGVSHMDIRGNKMIKDYFHDVSPSCPDLCGFSTLSKEAKIAKEISSKDFVPDVYVRYPYTICMDRFGDGMEMKPYCDIINSLSHHQIQWKYLDENESANGHKIIEFSEEFEYILDGFKTSDAQEICNKLKKDLIITDLNGEPTGDIFVRRFDDGTTVAINKSADDKEFLFEHKLFKLYGYGVMMLNDASSPSEKINVEDIEGTFDVKYSNKNIVRCMYINNQDTFRINTTENTEVVFAIRNDANASLNGCKINATENDGTLPYGMNPLYNVSNLLLLNKGTNIITSSDDFKYMPSVIVAGDFSYNIISDDICEVTLDRRCNKYNVGDTITDFGEVIFSKKIIIPKDAKSIQILGTPLYTAVYIEDNLIGERCFAPYIYDIDEKHLGKEITIKIVQKSSIASVFGDVEFFNEHHNDVSWKTTPSSKPCEFGFSQIKILK